MEVMGPCSAIKHKLTNPSNVSSLTEWLTAASMPRRCRFRSWWRRT